MNRQSRMRHLLLLISLLIPFAFCHANELGETVVIQGSLDDDVLAMGGEVDMRAQVNGDILVFGGEVVVDSDVTTDAMIAGGEISVNGVVGDDVRIAGGDISLSVRIGDDLMVAGGDIRITPNTQIGGHAKIAGGDIEMAGSVDGELYIAGGEIELASQVRGNVELEGGEIEILESAVIGGNLAYRSHEEINIHPDAQILGTITRKPVRHPEGARFGFLIFPLTMMVAGITLYLLFPFYTVSAAQTVSVEPVKCLGLGLAILITTPFVAFILMGTMLGVWVGLTVLAFYFVAMIIALLIAAFYVGDWGAKLLKKEVDQRSRRILSLVIAVLVLSLVAAIPIIGGLIGFVLFLLGMGAAMIQLYRAYNATTTP